MQCNNLANGSGRFDAKRILKCILIALASYAVSFVIFAPRLWRFNSNNPDYAEVGRGIAVLVQLMNPRWSYPIGGETLEWRLLFPVVGHALHINPYLFLALPMIFCVILLAYVMYLGWQETQSELCATAITLLVATTSIIFVSTGFLGYFDSALMLTMLVAAFSRRDMTIWLAAVLAPWIDERFIFALPIIFWVQWVRTNKFSSLRPLILGIAPYLGLRAIAYFAHSETMTQSLVGVIFNSKHDPLRLVQGFWDSLRWGWLGVFAAFFFVHGTRKFWGIILLLASIIPVTLSNGDYSRSTAIALPMALLGFFQLAQFFSLKDSAIAGRILWGLVLLNFVTPAYHSFRAFHLEILPLSRQLKAPTMIKK